MAKRYELSDEAWTVVADLFTETHGRGRPRLSDRLMLDGVLWVLCSGAAWRDMPERLGPWSTVPGLAKPREIRSDAQTLAFENE